MTPRELYPNLYVSGHTRGLLPHQSLQILKAHQITRIVCVAPRADHDLAQVFRALGHRYDHIPLSDGKHIDVPTVRQLGKDLALDLVTRRSLVHCNAGRNRSPFIVALAAIYSGIPPQEIINQIRRVRATALANPHFVDFLFQEHP